MYLCISFDQGNLVIIACGKGKISSLHLGENECYIVALSCFVLETPHIATAQYVIGQNKLHDFA